MIRRKKRRHHVHQKPSLWLCKHAPEADVGGYGVVTRITITRKLPLWRLMSVLRTDPASKWLTPITVMESSRNQATVVKAVAGVRQ